MLNVRTYILYYLLKVVEKALFFIQDQIFELKVLS